MASGSTVSVAGYYYTYSCGLSLACVVQQAFVHDGDQGVVRDMGRKRQLLRILDVPPLLEMNRCIVII